MPLDIERNINIPNTRVSYSKTVELVCALSYLASKNSSGYADKDVRLLYNSLTPKSRKTLGIFSRMRLRGLELQEFVLREKIFDDLDLLKKRMRQYDRANFIFTFIGEELPLEKVQALCGDDEAVQKLLNEKESISNSREMLEYLFYKTEEFKDVVLELIEEIDNSRFDSIIKTKAAYYNRLGDEVTERLESRNPLDFSQEFYGKKFRRIYDFEDYLFVPSYFLKPDKIRFFNNTTQIIIYRADNEVLKKQEEGERLSNILKVLSDRTRLEILRELSFGERYGKTLAEKLSLTTSTISHHLDQLKEVGMVSEERIKNTKYFKNNKEEIDRILKEFKDYLSGR